MTIVDAIKIVLVDSKQGMTSSDIYDKIIERKLYEFPAKKPEAVVNGTIRKHCIDLDFPTAHPVKHFKIVSYKGKKPCYGLIEDTDKHSKSAQAIRPPRSEQADLLPEERIQIAYKNHIATLGSELLQQIQNNHPSFFERLIVDLLIKMGYGYDSQSGIVVGGPHDGGIDGVIYEDKLGLDLIYLQAKKYNSDNTVGVKDLHTFVGAMQNVQKGVFITTSSFSRDAVKFVEQQQQKSLKLIDGELLISLMIKHEVGVKVDTEIKLYKLDSLYFG